MNPLFSTLALRSISLKNRIALSPMCQYASVNGHPGDWQLMHLGTRAAGGAGLVLTEATAVSPEGRISPWDAGLWEDSQIASWKRIISFIHEQGSIAGIQLAHAGRKASADYPWKGGNSLSEGEGGWETRGPSAEAFGLHLSKVPKEMTLAEIDKLITDFGQAAKRAYAAGAKLIEIHAGHGYLLHEFLSPLTNKRSDDYGGSLENRSRLLLEIVQHVREVWPEELPIFVRISATDWDDEGWTIEDSILLSNSLKALGVDLVDTSSGFVAPAKKRYPVGPLWQVDLAARLKIESGLLTGTVGFITTAREAQDVIEKNQADLVLLGREFLRQPHWPMLAAKELGVDVTTQGSVRLSHWIK